MEPWMIATLKESGLIGLIMMAVIGLLFIVIKWTLATTKDIIKSSEAERTRWAEQMERIQKSWQIVTDNMNNSIVSHNERAKNFSEQVCEAHKYQREEHKEMIGNLKDITITLGRINGYNK